jgi:acyl dehydratase
MSSLTATFCISVSPTSAMKSRLFFEDFPAGEVIEYGGVVMSAEDIVAFAREFDPQPFHVDGEAAKAVTGGLIASGWHTSALLLRMNCEAFLLRAAVVEERGVEEIKWARPVRPGDRLNVRRQTLSAEPSKGGADAGELEFLFEVVNQDGAVALTQRSRLRLSRRAGAG